MAVSINGSGYVNSSYLGTANNIYTDSSGKVGIGLTPSYNLDVSGNIGIRNSANPYILMHDGTTYSYIQMASSYLNFYQSGAYPISFSTAATNRMTIDGNGRITMPSQPSFYVWSNYSSGGGPSGAYIFSNVDHNVGSCYSTATGRFTAPVAGRYLFMAAALSRSGSAMNFNLRKNGSSVVTAEDSRSGGFGEANATIILNLNASDYVDVYLNNASYGGQYDWFSGYLIG